MTQTAPGGARAIRVALPLCRSGLGLGTGVPTADGEIPVEFLEPGDRIVTLDRGAVRLARTIARDVPARAVLRVRPAVLHPKGEGRDLLISAQQPILLRDWRAQAMFGKPAVLVEAGRLVDGAHLSRLEGPEPVRLIQLVFDDGRHVVPVAGGHLAVASARLPQPARA